MFLHLTETGRLLDEHGEFRGDLQIDELDVPDTVRMLMMERLSRLTATTREALLAAAVSGRAFPFDVVAQVTGLAREALLDALDEAEHARLVTPARFGRLVFSHELVRQTLLGEVSSVRREDLHARIAAALEELHADDLAPACRGHRLPPAALRAARRPPPARLAPAGRRRSRHAGGCQQ